MNKETSKVSVVPHTHWDREWYYPFQAFRTKLVKLIDSIIEICGKQDFRFMMDGQTIVLEDYFEIKPENKEILLRLIREGKIEAGPWYLLPDEWLIGEESFIRNLELSNSLAKEFDIPLMQIAYLPDQFGHSKTIPQLLTNLTSFTATVLWRGVGPEVVTVPFKWSSHVNSHDSILGIYMPYGYGNAAALPEEEDALKAVVEERIGELQQYSPIPVYLLMYGTDHQFPSSKMSILLKLIDVENTEINLSLLKDYVFELKESIKNNNYVVPEYAGEFRSSARAHLLQDTYSARMWIKQWNQKIEDLLVKYAEPLATFAWMNLETEYPVSYFELAWKWLIKNHTHDGICGCSVDQVHEEMKARFHWAESIAESQLEEVITHIETTDVEEKQDILVFNPTNNNNKPIFFEFSTTSRESYYGIKDENGVEYSIFPVSSSEELIYEAQLNPFMLRASLKLIPGRKIIDFYVNDLMVNDGPEPGTCSIRIVCDDYPIGEFDIQSLRDQANQMLDEHKYKKYFVKMTKGSKQKYAAVAPLKSWCFTKFTLLETIKINDDESFKFSKNKVENKFYSVSFENDGSFSYLDKYSGEQFSSLHKFEDFGDIGDEYTFGRIGPEKANLSSIKRKVTVKNAGFCEIEQKANLNLFKSINQKRDKRIGKETVPIVTVFRFYRDIQRIDIQTKLVNTTKDHRLRICFDLPFNATETITSTHFGAINRKGSPIKGENYAERPSGIQPQKRYIRINNPHGKTAFTLMNKGLPEVELADETRLALTLVRSVGFLSRSDIEERPMHAGPFVETPGAQELNTEYIFEYSFVIHENEDPIYISNDVAEVFTLPPLTAQMNIALDDENLNPMIQIQNPWIKISSIRNKEKKLQITLYNLNENIEETVASTLDIFTKCNSILIDGSIKEKINIVKSEFNLSFSPFEIKIITLE